MHKRTVLKTILKFTLKLTLKQLQHVSVQSHHHQGAHYLCLLKLQLLKQPIKIHRFVVRWLHILVGPCWCVYAALFGSRLLPNSATYTHQQGPTLHCSEVHYF